jgi:hypothetical protein
MSIFPGGERRISIAAQYKLLQRWGWSLQWYGKSACFFNVEVKAQCSDTRDMVQPAHGGFDLLPSGFDLQASRLRSTKEFQHAIATAEDECRPEGWAVQRNDTPIMAHVCHFNPRKFGVSFFVGATMHERYEYGTENLWWKSRARRLSIAQPDLLLYLPVQISDIAVNLGLSSSEVHVD